VPNNRCTGARETGLVIVAERRRAPGELSVRHLFSRQITVSGAANMKKQSILTAVVVLILLWCWVNADVAPMTLERMIAASSIIVLGRVSKVTVFNPSADYPIKIAEVEVVETIKGPHGLKKVYYWASPGLACNVTTAQEGNTDLFLFRPGTRFRNYPQSLSAIIPKIKAMTGNRELAKIIHSGRGQMEIKEIDGGRYVLGSKRDGDIIFPQSIKMHDYPDPQYSNVGMVKIEDLVTYIRNYVHK
jgi:hypothetical protein